jgi:NAD(P)-dependent dehydrogenase (short-subunit alcohol dehydrogenase family)
MEFAAGILPDCGYDSREKENGVQLKDKVIVVTGAASGIGLAMCRRFAAEGPAGIVAADRDGAGAAKTAEEVGGLPFTLDATREPEVRALVDEATRRYGRIDLFCSNAGIAIGRDENAPDSDWNRSWELHVMAHVYAARAVLPQMLERGQGYLLNTASAAGLLTHINSAPYSVSKHAAVAFAEWLSIAHGAQGIRVSCLCPQGVITPLLLGGAGHRSGFLLEGALSAEAVAECVVQGIAAEQFLILPHPEVLGYMQRRAGDHERWLAGMRKARAKAQQN